MYLEIVYDAIKTKYMDAEARIYCKYLLENTTSEERLKYVKLLISGSMYSDELFQNYVDGKCEIDEEFKHLFKKI